MEFIEFNLKSCMAFKEANGQNPGLPYNRCLMSRREYICFTGTVYPRTSTGIPTFCKYFL